MNKQMNTAEAATAKDDSIPEIAKECAMQVLFGGLMSQDSPLPSVDKVAKVISDTLDLPWLLSIRKRSESLPQAAGAQVAQHTPVPWVSQMGVGCGILYNIGPEDSRPVLGVFHAPDKKQPILIAQANAEFIVRACNQHEDLLAQVEFASTCNAELRSRITELASALKNLQRNIQRFVANDAPPPWLIDADDQASEVLAKVATQNP